MHLLDTDVCIEVLRGNAQVLAHRRRCEDDVVTTWITAAELSYGASRSARPEPNFELVDAFLSTLPIFGFDAASVRRFGVEKTRLRRAGLQVADADLLIAAIALTAGATIVTGNLRHFGRFEGLKTVDWIRQAPEDLAGWLHEPSAPYDPDWHPTD